MALPCADNGFDAAVMALIFFVPDPAKGVADMKHVVKPGGAISAYVWDVLEPGGFPDGGDAGGTAQPRHHPNDAAARGGLAHGRLARSMDRGRGWTIYRGAPYAISDYEFAPASAR